MKKHQILFVIFILASLLLTACGTKTSPTPTDSPTSASVTETATTVIGIIESMDGTKWVVNGQTLIVEADVISKRAFKAGDAVKVKGSLQADGNLLVSQVETPRPDELATATVQTNTNDNVNSNNNDNANDNVSNDNTNSNTNDNINDNTNDNGNDGGNTNSNDNGNGNDNKNHGGGKDNGNDNHKGNGNDDH